MAQKRRGRRIILACTKEQRIPLHLSNFINDHGKGHEAAALSLRVFLIGLPMNAEKISKALNDNPDTYGRYEPYRFFNNENQIVIKHTDWLGNEHLIYITEEPYRRTEA